MDQIRDWLTAARDRLDEWGLPAWIGAMLLGFVMFFPVGLFLLGYLLWTQRLGSFEMCGRRMRGRRWRREGDTGNAAFDAYREETLRRLDEERRAFTDFMERLRRAKDQAEFEQFMRERSQGGPSQGPSGAPQSGGSGPTRGPNDDRDWGGAGGFTPQPAG